MSLHPTIRPATVDDIPALLTLYRQMGESDAPASPETARTSLQALSAIPGSAILLAETDGIPVATCTVFILPNLTRGGQPYALIENVVTAIDGRRQGFARACLDHACGLAWQAGCYKVMLMTGQSDKGTLTFYEKSGFRQSKTGFQKRRAQR